MTSETLFSCSQEGCREECSYPADMLALHNGAPICEDCYCDLPFKSKALDPNDEQETVIWHDLPRFVPPFTQRIEALEAELAKFKALAETLAGALDRIYMEDRRIVERWRQSAVTGDSHLDERIVLGRYAEIAAEALRQYKEARDAS